MTRKTVRSYKVDLVLYERAQAKAEKNNTTMSSLIRGFVARYAKSNSPLKFLFWGRK